MTEMKYRLVQEINLKETTNLLMRVSKRPGIGIFVDGCMIRLSQMLLVPRDTEVVSFGALELSVIINICHLDQAKLTRIPQTTWCARLIMQPNK
ncbi:hypothetical protein TNIN_491571 [Trichonephila inaurata madagascariensis]|uniref:Uncharacterized protein n=1 Tax=Trichonephila inaurata madagascariensis TaxID=2747483 RepID=A0A8X7CE32_9ARAC|nr:hypothetical protein TNIN_491571 [Trichonephila inaurata madagascariensis]